jgi:hypothetical protein
MPAIGRRPQPAASAHIVASTGQQQQRHVTRSGSCRCCAAITAEGAFGQRWRVVQHISLNHCLRLCYHASFAVPLTSLPACLKFSFYPYMHAREAHTGPLAACLIYPSRSLHVPCFCFLAIAHPTLPQLNQLVLCIARCTDWLNLAGCCSAAASSNHRVTGAVD